jgi:hypothetical protein
VAPEKVQWDFLKFFCAQRISFSCGAGEAGKEMSLPFKQFKSVFVPLAEPPATGPRRFCRMLLGLLDFPT